MLQENIVKNDSMCGLLCYCFLVKLQNFLIAPRIKHVATLSCETLAPF